MNVCVCVCLCAVRNKKRVGGEREEQDYTQCMWKKKEMQDGKIKERIMQFKNLLNDALAKGWQPGICIVSCLLRPGTFVVVGY